MKPSVTHEATEDFKERLRVICGPETKTENPSRRRPGDRGYFKTSTVPTEPAKPGTIGAAIKKAVAEGNAAMAGRIADRLRFGYGMNYAQTAAAFEHAAGCNAEQFEALMYRADTEENRWEPDGEEAS